MRSTSSGAASCVRAASTSCNVAIISIVRQRSRKAPCHNADMSSAAKPAPAQGSQRIPRPVWFLGFTSLFTDAATEIIYPLLPIYLRQVLGASATSLGIIEGVAEGVNSLLKVISGSIADRRSRRRPLVIIGYAISSAARPLIALTTGWKQVL